MSLVEKALNKIKEAERRAARERTEAAAAEPPVVPLLEPALAASQSTATATVTGVAWRKMLPADVEIVRAKGYLPPHEQEDELTEQYRHIKRTLVGRAVTLGRNPLGRRASVIMVTSALPGEGKTFTAINLARSLTREQDATVLLVDADVANPQATRVFDADLEPGLVDALSDPTSDPNDFILDTALGIQLLPAGQHTELGAELFGSQRMGALIDRLLEAVPNRLILLDSSPILITNEGKALAQLPGQVVLVVHANSTPQQAVVEAAELFDEDQFVGVVLNQSDEAVGGGHYYGSYSYGGRYDYGKQGTDAKAAS